MKRVVARYAVLSRLLDEALDLDESGRVKWLKALPDVTEEQRSALHRVLTLDRAASNRKLKRLETHLRSSARAVRRLCGEP